MKEFITFLIIALILGGCGEINKFLSKNNYNKNQSTIIQKKKSPSVVEKKEFLNNSKIEEGIVDIEYENTNNKEIVQPPVKDLKPRKFVKKNENKLDNLINSLNNLNLNVNTRKIHLKQGNLLLVNLGPIIHFDTNKFNIKKEYRPKLNKIIDVLKKDKNFILIVGHTDSVGSDVYNQKLSELRAREVYDYFISKGIDKKRIDYIGYGEEQPIATNATPEGRAKNRRVELLISNDENLSNYFLSHRKINKMYLNNHNSKLAGKVIVTEKGWSKNLNETEIKKLENKFSQPRRKELIPHLQKRTLQINLKKRELIFKGVK